MRTPDYTAMSFADSRSHAARELEFFHRVVGESSELKTGDRVYFITVDGEFPGTVMQNWASTGWPPDPVHVTLDCRESVLLKFHRSLFRAFTALDRMAQI